ncbi:MAG: hypothetical protein A2542_01770 [Parcubacteria group bacterium RIFOXYD2_FULL_52_8]|nr:MAG: hypothetical protein A2542_01770 [Parcubacteria group bacterium RIFOXYD2_FULL_52_8]
MGNAVAEQYAKEGGGVVTSPDPFLVGYLAWKIARRYRLPLHLQLHTDIFHPRFRAESWRNRLYFLLAWFLLKRAQGIRVVARGIQEQLTSRWGVPPERIMVLPVFVDTEHLAETQPAFSLQDKYPQLEKIVLVVSRLTPEKRVDLAIKVFAEIRKTFPRAGLVVVGDGPALSTLQLLSTSYHLQDSVIFAGWQNDVLSYYKGVDALLVTSLYEGYGMQIVEALASGCPVVSTDVGVATEAGATVARDEQQLPEVLAKILREGKRGELRASFRMNKQAYTAQYIQSLAQTCNA